MADAGVSFRSAPTMAGRQAAPVGQQSAAFPLQAALSRPMSPPTYPAGGERVAAGFGTPLQGGGKVTNTWEKMNNPRNLILVVGTMLVVLIVINPVWNALLLLSDPVFVFFVGRLWPLWIIAACLAAVVGYALAMLLFFRYAREETQRDISILMIATVVVTALGLALLLLSLPVMTESEAAYHNILGNCEMGPRTRGLYSYMSVLQGIRSGPDCAKLESVELCQGYQESKPYTGFLKAMEGSFKCSGFCGTPGIAVAGGRYLLPAAAPAPSPGGSMIKAMHSKVGASALSAQQSEAATIATQEERDLERAVRPHAGISGGLLQANVTRQADAKPQMGTRDYTLPPTLFTTANFDASCDGLAAWNVRFLGERTGELFYQEGVILLLCTVIVGMLKLISTAISNNASASGKQRQEWQRQHLQQQFQQRGNAAPIET